MAEEFARCNNCGQGWFEKKEFVLIRKESPIMKKPALIQTHISYQCIGCGESQYDDLIDEE
jgi:hypothetical protein